MAKIVLIVALLLAVIPANAQNAPFRRSPIDPARLSAIIRTISADDFAGRGPGTWADAKTTNYLAKQFASLGIQPGGENGSWFQKVPLARFEVVGPVKLTLIANGRTTSLTQGKEIVVQTLVPQDRVRIVNAPLIFVGYGVKAPECSWDDFKGIDLRGKIAVVLVNDPDFEAPQLQKTAGCFGGRAITYYGRWTYKYEEAARRGALGMLIVHETGPAAYGWATVRNSNAIAQFDIVRSDAALAHPLLQGWIQRDFATALFKESGLDFEAEKHAAQNVDFRPVVLKKARLSADYAVQHSQIVSSNVVGRIPGAARANETIIYSAHWDHLGVGPPDGRGDRIYNGAIDNGTGIATLLELARAFANAKTTSRSILFLALTAEEKGLLGSVYYTTHPLYPLATTVADINIDALMPDGRAHDLSTAGSGKVDIDTRLHALLKSDGRYLSPDREPEKGYFYRADHFSFAREGVPAISIVSGTDLLNGGKSAGMAWRSNYFEKRYHQPADEWNPSWDMAGIAEDGGVMYSLGRLLANSREWPNWNSDSEFRTIRDQTVGQRN